MERDHLEDLGVDGIYLKWVFKKWGGEVGTGFLWIRIGTGGGRSLTLWRRNYFFNFSTPVYKM